MELRTDELETPVGTLRLAVSGPLLVAVGFSDRWDRLEKWLRRRFGPVTFLMEDDPDGIGSALGAYFRGEMDALDALPLDPGGTPFQRKVWTALRRVRAGHTTTYAQIASKIGAPKGVRAVGAANRANPISIVIPCHRVVGSKGDLVGYGGGLERKRWLLEHESRHAFSLQP